VAGFSALSYEAPVMIVVTPRIVLDERELEETFVRSSGPGGQNVNKLSTAVQLRFDVRRSPSLPDDVRARLERLAGSRLTGEGVLIILAQRHRTQERNREDARERLIELIRRAAVAPTPRRPTKPTFASKRRRLDAKVRRGRVKSLRGDPAGD
jgi:ribosome-associated protein